MTKKQRQHVQFSKKMVVWVVSSDFLLCVVAILLVIFGQDMTATANIISTYTGFASVVFIAYSGNSMLEKSLLTYAKVKARESAPNVDDDDDDEGNG